MYILGINAYHGDAAAALIQDGRIVAAVEEERFNRIKHCAGFPVESIKYCLSAAGIGIEDVEHVGISRDPSAHLHKKILRAGQRAAKELVGGRQQTGGRTQIATVEPEETHLGSLAAEPNGNGHGPKLLQQIADRLRNAARVRDLRDELAKALGLPRTKISAQFHNVEHHRAHLASAFFVSPFDRAALLSLDGFGDFISTMWGVGEGNSIKVLGQVEYPHSLGIVYTATTQFLGFPHYGDEGKVMGLAPYGKPSFIETFRDVVRTEPNGQFRLNLDYFRHASEGVEMTWNEGSPRIGKIFTDQFRSAFGPPRDPQHELTQRHRDLAASLQLRLEEVAFHVLNHLHRETGLSDLGLAGGVAYNSVMNGKILLNTPFRRVFVQPASGDSGTALGVCYQVWNQLLKQTRSEVLEGSYTGPEFSNEEIVAELERANLKFERLTNQEVTVRAARDIADGEVVGWFQGRLEFGPRALGNRSIVVDPRRTDMKDILNARIKKRESFRPFAPSILAEHVGDYFEQTHPAPTMLMVYQIKPARRGEIPAVTHVDGSGRLQTVSRSINARYYGLIEEFYRITGVPVVLNTSFNEDEPIVCSPLDAIECFRRTRMDVLYLGNHVVRRN
ncbi:MAG: carbamoyltransferase [Acidobacteriota bacterium]